MPLGTTSMTTIAERIKLSGKSLRRISKTSELPESRLSEILEGAEPSLAELRKLAVALRIPLSDFAVKAVDTKPVALLFRQTMGQLKQSQSSTVDLLSSQMESSLQLLDFVGTPTWLTSFSGSHTSYLDAERDAETFRDLFFSADHVSPLFKLPKIAIEGMDVILFVAQIQGIDGASALINGVPFVVVSARFPPRMLFTLAHEIGHVVAHHQTPTDFAILDGQKSIGGISRSRDKREAYVDVFASCLLMPRAGVGISLKKIREMHRIEQGQLGDVEILFLARIFGVSFQVAARRCEDLALLPRGGANSLYTEICRVHHSPEKRAEELGLPPRPEVEFPPVPPRLLESAVARIRSGEVSIGAAAAALNISISSLVDANRRVHP